MAPLWFARHSSTSRESSWGVAEFIPPIQLILAVEIRGKSYHQSLSLLTNFVLMIVVMMWWNCWALRHIIIATWRSGVTTYNASTGTNPSFYTTPLSSSSKSSLLWRKFIFLLHVKSSFEKIFFINSPSTSQFGSACLHQDSMDVLWDFSQTARGAFDCNKIRLWYHRNPRGRILEEVG